MSLYLPYCGSEDRIQLFYNTYREQGLNPIWAGIQVQGMTVYHWEYFKHSIIPLLERNYIDTQ